VPFPIRIFAASLLLGLSGCSLPSNETGEVLTRTGELVAMSGGDGGARNACFTCHGLDGMGDGVSVPRLAGLDAGYLQKQMEDYATDFRHDDAMTRIAARLDQRQRRAVAAFYTDMPTPVSNSIATPPPAIWLSGDQSRGVTACATCHGMDGLGVGPGNPAVAGQPAAYTAEQIKRWQTGKRRNEARGVMAQAVANLTEAEAGAIGRWLERQPVSRSPDSGAARVSAAASAAARPAPLHEAHRPGR
jgi:cytochrome c553